MSKSKLITDFFHAGKRIKILEPDNTPKPRLTTVKTNLDETPTSSKHSVSSKDRSVTKLLEESTSDESTDHRDIEQKSQVEIMRPFDPPNLYPIAIQALAKPSSSAGCLIIHSR
jgi:hypothetical protein